MVWSVIFVLLSAGTVQAGQLVVPSGRTVALQEVIFDTRADQNIYRFRFVTPDLARDDLADDMAEIETDMAQLCDQFALPFINNNGDVVERVVISFADRETEFGVATPKATQVYEIYSVTDKTCVWEPF